MVYLAIDGVLEGAQEPTVRPEAEGLVAALHEQLAMITGDQLPPRR